MVVDFAKRMEMAVGNTVFQKRQEQPDHPEPGWSGGAAR